MWVFVALTDAAVAVGLFLRHGVSARDQPWTVEAWATVCESVEPPGSCAHEASLAEEVQCLDPIA